MTDLPVWRLNLLRMGYLVMVVGLGTVIWPSILNPATTWQLHAGLFASVLAAFVPLALLGLRYPLQMLPLLFFEMMWKAIWLLRMVLPLWLKDHSLDAAMAQSASECLLIVFMPLVIPWDYVLRHYVRKNGDPWRRGRA
jgi:hypothetical protein